MGFSRAYTCYHYRIVWVKLRLQELGSYNPQGGNTQGGWVGRKANAGGSCETYKQLTK